ncbi:MAG: bifunctional UDP-N-acetylglucosamine diphosphorylase/glucosamine-1-phosphate N-acetyltransferase GlmU [Burkholderiales bacterium]|nr:bifunctional UDP-N-acetylglucosamine diphosphorylase/glucosamine-1-phosphate N-acetyltransferase GlmU [Burkholderiales bacterium]
MSTPLNIVILAAGKGTRMYSDLPKVLHPLAGRALLDHVLATARGLKPKKLCVVYGYGGDTVPNSIAGEDITWVQQAEQLGTGHALQKALPHLNATGLTLVLYGDVPLTREDTLQRLLDLAGSDKMALLTAELPDPTGYGRIVRSAEGRVERIVEQKDATDAERQIREINTGILAAPSAKLSSWLGQLKNNNAQGEYYLTDTIAMAVSEGVPVKTSHPHALWEVLGVNSKLQLAELERIYQRNYAEKLANRGVMILDPARFDVRGELDCGRDVVIDVNCVFEGKVVLGNNVSIGANCVLKNVTVAEGTKIQPFSHIEDTQIGDNCRIGPFARIRPGTTLASDAHIGNFVEIKNSQIGVGSKVNHLSYVGDATVGSRVNIGAGTITCNYDGANKHRTVIEDEVFIGSDTQLVAPVTVAKGATIGAGSTITRDAPAGELTISRVKQVTITGWTRPVKKPKGE